MNKITIYIKDLLNHPFENERMLSDEETITAKFIGIDNPSVIRVVEISKDDFRKGINEEANMLLKRFNLVKDTTNAITLGNKIFFFESSDARKTIAHELVHIYQYQQLGIDAFVQLYLNDEICKKDYKERALEIPAYKFANDYKNNDYSTDNLDLDNYGFIPD